MSPKYDQLSQLKTLLDSGALTQEEFEAAKKRILDPEGTPQPKESSPKAAQTEKKVSSSTKKPPKWLIPTAIAAIAVIVVIIVALSGTKNSSENTYDVTEEIVSDTAYVFSEEDYEPIDGLTLGNPWRKDYFKNEWGENNTDAPYIYAILEGTGWNIQIDYLPPTEESRWGVFRFYLLDGDGHLTSSHGPVSILVRGADGVTNSIEVIGTRDGITFVENPSEIELLKHYLDEESFDIQMEFDKYNERHRTQARWDACQGSFEEAKNKYL